MYTNRGFVGIGVLIAIILGVVVLGGGAYFVVHQQPSVSPTAQLPTLQESTNVGTQTAVKPAPMPVSKKPATQTTPTPVASDETANWKTYRNDTLGFEFKYPPQINGNTLSVTTDYSPTGGVRFHLLKSTLNPITVTANRFSDFSYPEQRDAKDGGTPVLTVGVDLGGSGGYIFDPSNNRWHTRDNVQVERTWEEMYNYFNSYLPDGLAVVKTASDYSAFPFSGSAYESSWEGYRIFDTERRVYLNINHGIEYAPENMRSESENLSKAIRAALPTIAKTVKFF